MALKFNEIQVKTYSNVNVFCLNNNNIHNRKTLLHPFLPRYIIRGRLKKVASSLRDF